MKQLLLVFSIAFGLTSCHFKNKEADMIVHNAKIYTLDTDFTTVEAMAIKDGVIIAMGPEREILNEYSAKVVIDAQKRAVYPGFIDAHCHFLGYGQTLNDVDLVGTKSFDEVLQRVKTFYDQKVADGTASQMAFLLGRGWDQNDWDDKSFPDRAKLDEMFPNMPVILKRIDGHASLVNEAALRLKNITPGQEIKGGEFVTVNGRLTGVLIDNAMDMVDKALPAYTEEQMKQALLAAQERCFAVGLTTVDDAGLMKREIDVIKSLHAAGTLKMRIYAMLADDPINFEYYLKSGIDTTSKLSVRSFKFYADGALGSRGACLLNPYSDVMPEVKYGKMLKDATYFEGKAYELRKHGFQMCTHAIGDSANRVMLKIYERVMSDSVYDHRWRIEHAQVVHESDVSRFGLAHIIPSIQPTHATSDMPWAAERLGRNRVYRAYTYRELLEENGMVALGTDFPIEDISTIATFYAAVARKDRSGQPAEGWMKENALTREQALRGMTIWAAISNFEDHHKGTLEVGKYADFVILSQDLMEVSEDRILETKVLKTILGGEVVFDSNKR